MKLLVTSDLHLSDRIWRHRPIEGDSYHSWAQIVNLAIAQHVDGVILAGDILDKQQNLSVPIQHLLAGLAQLRDACIPVYFNQGQHEYQQSPWMDLDPETRWLHHDDLVTPEGWRIAGCDYQNADNLQAFLRSPRALAADILVCHQVWKDFMGEHGKPQGEFADIPANVKILITGDYHEHICQNFGSLTVLSPGSTHMRSISEPENHEVFLLELGTKDTKPKIQSLPLYTRPCIRLDTKSLPDFKALKKHTNTLLEGAASYAQQHDLPPAVRLPLVRLSHRTDEDELVRQFADEFRDRGHLFFRQVTSPTADEPSVIDYLDASDRVSLINCLDQFVDPQTQPLTHSLAVALLQSPDPEQTLHRWIQEQTQP